MRRGTGAARDADGRATWVAPAALLATVLIVSAAIMAGTPGERVADSGVTTAFVPPTATSGESGTDTDADTDADTDSDGILGTRGDDVRGGDDDTRPLLSAVMEMDESTRQFVHSQEKRDWKAFRLRLPATAGSAVDAELSLWGRGSFSLSEAGRSRRSFLVRVPEGGPPVGVREDIGGADTKPRELRMFLLLSMFEDANRLKYHSSASVLRSLGLWPMTTTYCELSLRGDGGGTDSLGVYLLVEWPPEAVRRAHPGAGHDFAMRGGKGDQLLSVPSFKPTGPLPPSMDALVREVKADRDFDMSRALDTDTYVTWLAVNSLLQNGDYNDEVWFFAAGGMWRDSSGGEHARLGMVPWDYDSIQKKCHDVGKRAGMPDPGPEMYCAETTLDHFVYHSPRWRADFDSRMRFLCAPGAPLSAKAYAETVGASAARIAAYFARSPRCRADTFDGGRGVDPLEAADRMAESLAKRKAETDMGI